MQPFVAGVQGRRETGQALYPNIGNSEYVFLNVVSNKKIVVVGKNRASGGAPQCLESRGGITLAPQPPFSLGTQACSHFMVAISYFKLKLSKWSIFLYAAAKSYVPNYMSSINSKTYGGGGIPHLYLLGGGIPHLYLSSNNRSCKKNRFLSCFR